MISHLAWSPVPAAAVSVCASWERFGNENTAHWHESPRIMAPPREQGGRDGSGERADFVPTPCHASHYWGTNHRIVTNKSDTLYLCKVPEHRHGIQHPDRLPFSVKRN